MLAMAPTTATKIIKSINDRIKPAMAMPRGLLNRPIKENRAPRNHVTQLTPGSQNKMMDINARTNPAVPAPLDCWPLLVTITCCHG